MKVLGIESSCDETAAAVVEDGKKLLSNVVASSMDLQSKYGGVVPEIAARSHIEAIIPVVEQALSDARCTWDDIDAIAVTYGAGLGGSLLVGVMTARTLAIAKNKPLYGVNHVEAHIYVNFLTEVSDHELVAQGQAQTARNIGLIDGKEYTLPAEQPVFPMLGFIVSGNHAQLVLWQGHFKYTLLGQTHDDAVGEAYDKVAKIIGLPYPGGPNVEKLAASGNAYAYSFPKSKIVAANPALDALRKEIGSDSTYGYDFSFSGVKTAVLRAAQTAVGKNHEFPSFELQHLLSDAQKADIAASFQRIATETLVDKAVEAVREFRPKSVVIGGGVAASTELRRQLAERLPFPAEYTDRKLCTDNGAMVATLGCYHAMLGRPTVDPYSLEIAPNLSM